MTKEYIFETKLNKLDEMLRDISSNLIRVLSFITVLSDSMYYSPIQCIILYGWHKWYLVKKKNTTCAIKGYIIIKLWKILQKIDLDKTKDVKEIILLVAHQ